MNRSPLTTGALAVVATSALIGLGTATATALTPDPMTPGTSHERGTLIECTGNAGTVPVRANIYQNRTYGNYLELLVHDGTPAETGRSVEARKPFVVGSKVRAAAKVDGTRLSITGTAKPTGRTKPVREVIPNDGGMRIVSTGTHRLLEPVLTVRYDGQSGRLTCDSAFHFKLKVKKTSVID